MIVLRQQKVVGGTRSEAKDRRWYAGEAFSTSSRATSEGFSFSKLIAGVETRFPRRTAEASAEASAQASAQ